jgi:hypothetical protein
MRVYIVAFIVLLAAIFININLKTTSTSAQTAPNACLMGDANQDGSVDVIDFAAWKRVYKKLGTNPASAYGPRTAPGTKPNPAIPGNAVHVNPSNAANVISSNPAGTTYAFDPGTYTNLVIQTQTGDTFIGMAGAVLDGSNTIESGIVGDGNNVTVRNLTVTHYTHPPEAQGGSSFHKGAINPGWGTTGWVVEDTDILDNQDSGITLIGHMTIRRSRILDNGRIGIIMPCCDVVYDGSVVEDNEIARNGFHPNTDVGWEGGGTKFTFAHNLLVQYNESHHNHGAGLWTDIDNVGTQYLNNYLHDNMATSRDNTNHYGTGNTGSTNSCGIFHEISGAAKISNNKIVHNCYDQNFGGGTMFGAGILAYDSPDVEIDHNIVTDNANAIGAKQDDRGDATPRWRIGNINIHDNVWSGGRCGLDISSTVAGPVTFTNNSPKCEGEQ